MAILIVEHAGTVEGASLSGRILIGRRTSNHVVVDDPAVSRIHAWIDTADQKFTITDAGSRTGTFVNGHRVAAAKVTLRHGDRISVGPASLTFRTDGSLPAGLSELNFTERAAQPDGGILFDCTCGAPLWISSDFAGRVGKCRFCGAIVQVPNRPGVTPIEDVVVPTAAPTRTASPASPSAACGVCQSSIEPGEATTTCPECGLTFHAGCWTENFGCSAYGCSQVNVLVPKTEDAPVETESENAVPSESAEAEVVSTSRIPPAHALLAGSVGGLILGTLTFGVPALAALVATFLYLRRHRGRRKDRIVLAALVIATLGVAIGVWVSCVWWLTGRTSVSEIGVWSET